MQTKEQIVAKLRELLPELRKEFFVEKIGLFGSVQKNDFNEASDLDILVEFERSPGWGFFRLQDFLEKKFNRKIDLVTPRAIRREMADDILGNVEIPE